MWRDLERHQPDGGHAKAMQVIQPAHQSLEVANAVAVGIHEGSNGYTVDNRVLVPKVVDHRARRWNRSHQPRRWAKGSAAGLDAAQEYGPLCLLARRCEPRQSRN